MPSGEGALWYPDGTRWQGNFQNGQPHGVMTIVFPSGRPRQAFVEHGVVRSWIGTEDTSYAQFLRLMESDIDLRYDPPAVEYLSLRSAMLEIEDETDDGEL